MDYQKYYNDGWKTCHKKYNNNSKNSNSNNNNINNNNNEIYINNDSIVNNHKNKDNSRKNDCSNGGIFLLSNFNYPRNSRIHHSCWCYTTKKSESGFYKFLARFSGRRRRILLRTIDKLTPIFACILLVISLFSVADACSSRTTPKPRPPPTPTPRPNITFHTYKCPPTYAAWYCLNEATCFTVKIGDEILYNCECADGYMGPRCEYKDLDGSYLPTRPRIMLETASIASGATLAFIFVLILCIALYIRWHHRQKLERLSIENGGNGGADGLAGSVGVDTIDGGVIPIVRCEHHGEKRPFGPHHYNTIPMEATFKR